MSHTIRTRWGIHTGGRVDARRITTRLALVIETLVAPKIGNAVAIFLAETLAVTRGPTGPTHAPPAPGRGIAIAIDNAGFCALFASRAKKGGGITVGAPWETALVVVIAGLCWAVSKSLSKEQ